MIIGIDGNEANVERRVGVNQYAYELIRNLQKLQEKGECNHDLIVYLKDSPLPDMPKETQNFKYKVIKGGGFWIITKLMLDLFFEDRRPDIFFSPSHYVPPISPMPKVCSIMDLGYLEFSEQFSKKDFWQLTLWSAISIFVSKAIFAISNSTKKDIVRHYPFSKGKIHITYLGYDNERFNDKVSKIDVRRIKNKYSIDNDYILYISTLKPSKNVTGLIEAFSKLIGEFPSLSLVIAGKKGWLYEPIFKKVKDLGLEKKVVFTDYFPDGERPALMAGCKLYALPSFWEGFGIEVLNAFACGKPVVASNAGSLPEVVGNAGILVDPYNPDSIASGIKEVLTASNSKYNSMVSRGFLQAKKFSWEKCARETLKILENVKR